MPLGLVLHLLNWDENSNMEIEITFSNPQDEQNK